MYIPNAFRKDDIEALHTLMQEHSFATLVTCQDGVPFATHLPLLLDTERGPYGTLRGHVARGNPQWRFFDDSREVLVIFQGPHAYITPSWYEVELSVPTWNYAAVHVYGKGTVFTDEAQLKQLLLDIITRFDSAYVEQWSSFSDQYRSRMMQHIVGFEIIATRIETKFKLSQNRTKPEQEKVTPAVAQQPVPSTPQPTGTAAAQAGKLSGNAASRPAGAAIAPAKQRQVRSFLIKMGVIAGAGVAIGTVALLSKGTSPKPPGAR